MRRCRLCALVMALAMAGCTTRSGSQAEPPADARDADRSIPQEDALEPRATEVPPARAVTGTRATNLQFAWPLIGRVTSPFGPSGKREHHAGIDIDGAVGDPIRAAADGEIARIADHPLYGLLVVIVHDRGFATWYGHATDLFVGKGDTVTRGQVIALVGETGNARGTHLHFEVRRNGRPINPLPLLSPNRS